MSTTATITKTITLYRQELDEYADDKPPADAPGFLAWFVEKLSQIPGEHRDSATVLLEPGYLHIFYHRPESEEEVADRVKRDERAARQHEQHERQLFERLKKQFEP